MDDYTKRAYIETIRQQAVFVKEELECKNRLEEISKDSGAKRILKKARKVENKIKNYKEKKEKLKENIYNFIYYSIDNTPVKTKDEVVIREEEILIKGIEISISQIINDYKEVIIEELDRNKKEFKYICEKIKNSPITSNEAYPVSHQNQKFIIDLSLDKFILCYDVESYEFEDYNVVEIKDLIKRASYPQTKFPRFNMSLFCTITENKNDLAKSLDKVEYIVEKEIEKQSEIESKIMDKIGEKLLPHRI
jgi:hypothetical protein